MPSTPATAVEADLAEPSATFSKACPQPSSPQGSGIVPQIHFTWYVPAAAIVTASPVWSPASVIGSRSEPSIGPATSLASPVMATPSRSTDGQPVVGSGVGIGVGVDVDVDASVGVSDGAEVTHGLAEVATAAVGVAADAAGAGLVGVPLHEASRIAAMEIAIRRRTPCSFRLGTHPM